MKAKKIHYSWVICFCGALMMFIGIGLPGNTFSGYLPFLIESGYTNTQVSTLGTIRFLSALGAMFFAVQYIKKTGVRLGIALAGLSAGLSFAAYGFARNYVMCCVGAVLSGFADSLGGLVPLSILISNWFKKSRSTAMGIVTAGTGVATIGIPSLQTWIIETYSMKAAFFAEAIFVLSCVVVIFLLVRDNPEEMGLEAYGAEHGQENAENARSLSLDSGGLHGKMLVLMCIAVFPLGTVGTTAFTNLQILYTTAGIEPAHAAVYFTVAGGCLTLGKLLYGKLADSVGVYKTSFLFFGCVTFGLVLCCFADNGGSALACAAMALYGFGISLTTVGFSTIIASLSTAHDYPWTLRKTQIIYKLGSLAFSFLPGVVADSVGSYVPTYYMFVVLSVMIAVMILMIYRRVRPRNMW